MGRIRTIKPEFPQSESVGRLSRDARLLFIMLWTIVDDVGRARAASRMLASILYPYDDDAKNKISAWLAELEQEGCITLYEVDGNSYLQIEKWLEHQKIDHPTRSRLPEPLARTREDSRVLAPDLVPSTKDQKKDMPAGAGLDGFEDFWKSYKAPPNSKKPDTKKAWLSTAKTRPPLPDLLRAVSGYLAWLAEEWRKNKREFPAKQHPASWLRGEVWNGYLGAATNVPTYDFAAVEREEAEHRARKLQEATNVH